MPKHLGCRQKYPFYWPSTKGCTPTLLSERIHMSATDLYPSDDGENFADDSDESDDGIENEGDDDMVTELTIFACTQHIL